MKTCSESYQLPKTEVITFESNGVILFSGFDFLRDGYGGANDGIDGLDNGEWIWE